MIYIHRGSNGKFFYKVHPYNDDGFKLTSKSKFSNRKIAYIAGEIVENNFKKAIEFSNKQGVTRKLS